MGEMHICRIGGGPTTTLKGVTQEEYDKAVKNWHEGAALFIRYSPVPGTTAVYGTSDTEKISSLGFMEDN